MLCYIIIALPRPALLMLSVHSNSSVTAMQVGGSLGVCVDIYIYTHTYNVNRAILFTYEYVYIYIYTCVYIYIYIYIYVLDVRRADVPEVAPHHDGAERLGVYL